jgi:hypothetical protein
VKKTPAAIIGLGLVVLLACLASAASSHERAGSGAPGPVFAAFAEDSVQLKHARILAESIRTFAGSLRGAPIRIYVPRELIAAQPLLVAKVQALRVEIRASEAPDDALRFPFARKVFAAAQAETDAAGRTRILVWMDEDTIVLQEPRDFLLPRGVSLAYRPVTHQRIGSSFDQPPDAFWSRVYERLAVPESAVFAVVTPADSQRIRAYFNAGLLVVRPERGILRRWAADFPVLYRDTVFVEMCRQDRFKALFLHQAALAGAILSGLGRREMLELSPRHNFPLFFREMYGARREFDSIADVVTLRYDVYFQNPAPDWSERLEGPPGIVAWLKDRLGRE